MTVRWQWQVTIPWGGILETLTVLDSAMNQYIEYIVLKEKRSFWFIDFQHFSIEGKEYSMRHGTFRNKISKLLKNGKAVTDYYSSCALYTLPGHQFGKNVMTRNHPQIQIHNHPFYRFLQDLPLGKYLRIIFNLSELSYQLKKWWHNNSCLV